MNSMDYQDTLQKGIVFFFNRGNRKKTYIFQKDNAVIHKKLIDNALVFHEEDQSPCLTSQLARPQPLENVWGVLARAVYRTETVLNCKRAQECRYRRMRQDLAIIPRFLQRTRTTDCVK
uniref:Uncharacterized protein n=1 Tax=Caenorhabditis japonica TaxID=281687 RepID=A0A8R1I476_CAEJA